MMLTTHEKKLLARHTFVAHTWMGWRVWLRRSRRYSRPYSTLDAAIVMASHVA
jgi:hypothetical protein